MPFAFLNTHFYSFVGKRSVFKNTLKALLQFLPNLIIILVAKKSLHKSLRHQILFGLFLQYYESYRNAWKCQYSSTWHLGDAPCCSETTHQHEMHRNMRENTESNKQYDKDCRFWLNTILLCKVITN